MFLYNNYYDDGQLTESEFLDALSKFPDADKLDIVSPPDKYIPADDEYEVDEFYQ